MAKLKRAQNGDWMSKFNAQTRAEQKNPKLAEERRRKEDSTMKSDMAKNRAVEHASKIKEGYKVEYRPGGSTVYTAPKKKKEEQKNGGKITKMAKKVIKKSAPKKK
jgi:hypothetical protein